MELKTLHLLLVKDNLYDRLKNDHDFLDMCNRNTNFVQDFYTDEHIERMEGYHQHKGYRIATINTKPEPIENLLNELVETYGIADEEIKTETSAQGCNYNPKTELYNF